MLRQADVVARQRVQREIGRRPPKQRIRRRRGETGGAENDRKHAEPYSAQATHCCAPRLLTPLWYPLQSVAAPGVARNRPYAHLYKAFRRTLSPLALLPSQRSLESIVARAKEELLLEIPILQRLCAPIAPLAA